ncbi:PREDICTED: nucleolar protein 12 [Nelumbo nucifera]|uniref:Nucleolar protein 12 n=2 Tax=Nelumbo nucifera TaxID=4432 RepID=A0A1U8B4G9_NELNU|nr:PREDICTED: nucleolar protein 12 [Nelumbo nucifera]DAD36612.1 TPA_asm: hypothetical protein HUJ06_007253 [Nelumbo nucifera]
MAKKTKPKGGEAEKAEKKSHDGGSSSNVFKTLFGDIPDDGGGGVSLFSNNPFRRNHQEQQQQEQQLGLGFFGSGGEVSDDNPKGGGSQGNGDEDLGEEKKRKRRKERKPEMDADSIQDNGSESLKEAKKRKREERRNRSLDIDLIEKRTNEIKISDGLDVPVNMDRDGEENRNAEGKEKKKKKRKRDEIEEEYEARRYGVVVKVEDEEGRLGGKVVGEKRKTVDDPAEMLVSKEGFDDESKLLRTVFVGNLPLKVKKKAVLKEFSRFGEVESVRIRSVPLLDSKTPRKGAIFQGKINESVDSVHAYVVFKDEQSAQASLSHNMAMVGGNHIRVDRACPPRKKLKGENSPLYDRKRTVFVGNLPFDVKDEELYQLFCGINQLESNIEAVRVIRDPHTSVGKGIAYVLFKTRAAANLAVQKKSLKLRDRELRLYHAKPDSTPAKKRSISPTWADNSPKKRLVVASSGGASSDKGKAKARPLSYQGLRASKTGMQKKGGLRPRKSEQGNVKSKKGSGQKERKGKRPAVAARKAAMKSGATPRQPGKKRKLESRTPESSHKNKKAKKLK